jgi:arginine decarboxylase
MPDATANADRKSLGRYYNASQFRLDSWNQLKNACLRLAEGRVRDRDKALIHDMLDQLGPFEEYWAFPGHHNLAMLRRLYETDDFERLAIMSTRIVGALMSDSYRR